VGALSREVAQWDFVGVIGARAGAQIPGTRRLQEDTDGHKGAAI
jgi:hypothetical protein